MYTRRSSPPAGHWRSPDTDRRTNAARVEGPERAEPGEVGYMPAQKGFFASLFDVEFSELITPRIIRVVFMIGLAFTGLASLMWTLTMPPLAGGAILLGLIFSALLFLAGAICLRIWLEVIMVVFRIADDLRAVRASGQAPRE
ncbi:MAG TPA: hypothetical protein DEQ28_07425 [Clostridiales bacterium]|nr:hypothetical protein [Clostridiales bacterium]